MDDLQVFKTILKFPPSLKINFNLLLMCNYNVITRGQLKVNYIQS